MTNEKLSAEKQLALIRYALVMAQKVCHGRFCDPHPLGQAEVCKATSEAITLLDNYPATVRAEEREAAMRDAILLVDTAPLCHAAGKQYIDPVALVQRMNAAFEDATENRKGEG